MYTDHLPFGGVFFNFPVSGWTSDKFDFLVLDDLRDDTSVPDHSGGQWNNCLQVERLFSFTGLTLSDLLKSLVEGTLESIIRVKLGSQGPSIPFGRIR